VKRFSPKTKLELFSRWKIKGKNKTQRASAKPSQKKTRFLPK